EQERGLRIADAVIAGGGTLLTVLKPKGTLAPMEPFLILPEVTDTRLWLGEQLFHDKDKTGVGFMSSYMRYVIRNTDLVKPDEVTKYEDLLKPQFKKKIVMMDPTMTGATLSWSSGLARNRGIEQTKDFLRALVKQEPTLSRDVRFIYENVAKGKYSIGMEARPEAMAEFQSIGAPLAYAKINEISKLAPSNAVISLASQPAHPNAATVFVNWLLSKEGQTVASSKGWGAPSSRQDVPREGLSSWLFPGPDEKFFVQDEPDYMMQGEMRLVNNELFAPLRK
ncbi:MAG: extracellular solute-binding protein, partial [Chloroflexi bacterium]|nr:extracellular solute-binding protein [Chloroflexota bacterium]